MGFFNAIKELFTNEEHIDNSESDAYAPTYPFEIEEPKNMLETIENSKKKYILRNKELSKLIEQKKYLEEGYLKFKKDKYFREWFFEIYKVHKLNFEAFKNETRISATAKYENLYDDETGKYKQEKVFNNKDLELIKKVFEDFLKQNNKDMSTFIKEKMSICEQNLKNVNKRINEINIHKK